MFEIGCFGWLSLRTTALLVAYFYLLGTIAEMIIYILVATLGDFFREDYFVQNLEDEYEDDEETTTMLTTNDTTTMLTTNVTTTLAPHKNSTKPERRILMFEIYGTLTFFNTGITKLGFFIFLGIIVSVGIIASVLLIYALHVVTGFSRSFFCLVPWLMLVFLEMIVSCVLLYFMIFIIREVLISVAGMIVFILRGYCWVIIVSYYYYLSIEEYD